MVILTYVLSLIVILIVIIDSIIFKKVLGYNRGHYILFVSICVNAAFASFMVSKYNTFILYSFNIVSFILTFVVLYLSSTYNILKSFNKEFGTNYTLRNYKKNIEAIKHEDTLLQSIRPREDFDSYIDLSNSNPTVTALMQDKIIENNNEVVGKPYTAIMVDKILSDAKSPQEILNGELINVDFPINKPPMLNDVKNEKLPIFDHVNNNTPFTGKGITSEKILDVITTQLADVEVAIKESRGLESFKEHELTYIGTKINSKPELDEYMDMIAITKIEDCFETNLFKDDKFKFANYGRLKKASENGFYGNSRNTFLGRKWIVMLPSDDISV